jgi:hypothetical protein
MAGDWTRRPSSEKPVACVNLPFPGDRAWTVEESPDGMETIVLLARDTVLPDKEGFSERIGSVEPQSGRQYRRVIELKNGQLLLNEADRTRSKNLERTTPIEDPVLKNQQLIAEQVGDHFILHYSISFPIQGSGGVKDDH